MPVGEIIGEVLSPVFECLIYGASYWTGYAFLNAVTFGSVKLAPFLSGNERKKNKRKRYHLDWGIYENHSKKGKLLRADAICAVGFFVWFALGYGIYLIARDDGKSPATPQKIPLEKIEFTDPASVGTGGNESFSIRIEGEVNEPTTVELTGQRKDSSAITLKHMIERAKDVSAFGVYLYVIRETPDHFEISKFKVRSVKNSEHEEFKLHTGDLVYIGSRESALNVRRGTEQLSDNIQNRIKKSGKPCQWNLVGTHHHL